MVSLRVLSPSFRDRALISGLPEISSITMRKSGKPDLRARDPESSDTENASGFQVRAFGAPRNDKY
jgi:hypothetical protein